MPEYPINIAARYFKRQFEKGVGKSILKVLAELITNSDDSYRRLGASAGRIVVDVDRGRRQIGVIDGAEGLTDDDMIQGFVTYGAESPDRSQGVRTRSLFGKGLRDVLFTQKNGVVQSIKAGKAYVSKFRWRDSSGAERPIVEVTGGPRVADQLRGAWGIPGNGTRVQFGLRDDVRTPQLDRLARDLSNFYMLRLINQRPDREILLRVRNRDGSREERLIRYAAPAAEATTLLGSDSWTLHFDDQAIEVEASVSAYEGELSQGESSYEDREGGLLVIDEDSNVLDLTLFGYDEDPAAARLFGELRLHGAGKLIRSRLNAEPPEEILTETRDGFEHKHSFYKALRSQVDAWLKPYVDAEKQRLGSKTSALSDETRRRHQRAFDRLNRLYRQLLGDTSGSASGTEAPEPHTDLPLQFRATRAALTTGTRRTAHLMVNTLLVPPGRIVEIASDDSSTVFVPDATMEVPRPTSDEPTIVMQVPFEGLRLGDTIVRASADKATAALECSVADEEVPHLGAGLVFAPDLIELRDGERARATLYGDLRVIGAASVEVRSTNPAIEAFSDALRWEPVTNFIVRGRLPIIGRGKGEESFFTAVAGQVEALALAKVLSKRQESERQKGGMFKGVKFAAHDRKVQAMLDAEGYVVVNLNDSTNRLHFGGDPVAAQQTVESDSASQTLLAELVLGECLHRAVAEAYQKGKLRIRFEGDPTTDIRNYVAEQRFSLGAEIHRHFVRPGDAGGNG